MALVALQMAMVFLGVEVARRRPALLAKAASWKGAVLSFALMLGGVWGVLAWRGHEALAWLCFTGGALVMALQLARHEPASLQRGLLQAGGLLLAAAALAPFVDFYSGAGGLLFLLTLALLLSLLLSLVWPCAKLEAALSAGGAALFAVWTVHDLATKPCASPWSKSVEVFLDVFNLFAFSVQ